MQVETDKCLCNHVDKCPLKGEYNCKHSIPHTLRRHCTLFTTCRGRTDVICVPIMKELAPDWEI